MQENLDYVFFLYGLSFFLLAVISFRFWREKIKTPLRWEWLALFGFLHGANEWLDMVALSYSFNFLAKVIVLAIMAGSFFCLFEFGRRSCLNAKGYPFAGTWIYVPLLLLCIVCGVHGFLGWNVGFRYSFGLFGGLLASFAFFRRSSNTPFHHKGYLRLGAFFFFCYAFASGFIVPRVDFFPASVVNQDAFFQLTGVVIQAVRGFFAVLIAISCSLIFLNLKFSWSSEGTRTHIKEIFAGQAVILIFFVVFGWFFVQQTSKERIDSQKSYLLKQARSLSKAINIEHIIALKGTEDDVLLPQYVRIWEQLKKIVEVFPEYRFAYLMSKRDSQLIFLIDSEPSGSPDRSMPGDVYNGATVDFQNAFERKEESFTGPDTDEWGTWVTSAVPILDPSDGKLLAMFCLDRNAVDWTSSFFKDRLKGIGLVLVLSIFVLLGFFIFGRERPLGKKFFYAETFYVAGFCLLVTMCTFIFVFSKKEEDLFDKFQQVAINATQVFYAELNGIRVDIDHLSKFFAASREVSREEFHIFVSGLVHDYIGRQAFAWLPRVRLDEVALYEERAREEGIKDFFIFEKSRAGEKMRVRERPEYFPVYYLEPSFDNPAALGFDANSELVRHDALMRAQQSGLRCTTSLVDFIVSQKERKSGFLVYQPVYEDQAALTDRPSSSKILKGFVMAVIRPQSILETGLFNGPRGKKQLARITVIDLNYFFGAKVIASYPDASDVGQDKIKKLLARRSGELKEIALISFFDNSYAIVAVPLKSFFDEYPERLPWVVLWGGLFVTVVLSALAFVLQDARKHAERIVLERTVELVESEERFRSLFDNMGDGVAIYRSVDNGNDFVFVDLNRTGQRLSKISREAVFDKRITDIFPGVRNIGLLGALTRVWQTGIPEICPESLYKDGRIEQWVENFVCKLPSGLVAAIYTDVTGLKRSEQALTDAHEEMKSVLDAATRVSIISTDPSGIIRTFNKGAANILGYREDEVVGKQVYSFLHLESEIAIYDKELSREFGYPVSGFDTFAVRVKHGQREERDWTYVKKDGGLLTVNLVVTAIKDAAGVITGFVGIATDITERKQSEERLKESLADLQKFHAATINRESRVIELKKEINALSVKLGQEPPYDLSFLDES